MTDREIPVSDNHLVWYAAYGSNLLRSRFDCYIQGGKPKGATKEYLGCRDKTARRDARRFILTHSLYFANVPNRGVARSHSSGGRFPTR